MRREHTARFSGLGEVAWLLALCDSSSCRFRRAARTKPKAAVVRKVTPLHRVSGHATPAMDSRRRSFVPGTQSMRETPRHHVAAQGCKGTGSVLAHSWVRLGWMQWTGGPCNSTPVGQLSAPLAPSLSTHPPQLPLGARCWAALKNVLARPVASRSCRSSKQSSKCPPQSPARRRYCICPQPPTTTTSPGETRCPDPSMRAWAIVFRIVILPVTTSRVICRPSRSANARPLTSACTDHQPW